jgi:hypothetical protein
LRTIAGIVVRPAIFEARHRRSPRIRTYRPSAPGRTEIGWITPFARIEAANSSSVVATKSSEAGSFLAKYRV